MIGVVNLDAIAGPGRPRLELAGDTPRSPAPGLVETVRARLEQETGSEPTRPSALRQLVDLGFPYSRYEQAPFVTRGIPAVTITTAADRPAAGLHDEPRALDTARLGQIGRATQNAVDAMQQGVALEPGPSSYVYLGSRVVRGWAIELVLIGALLPFLAVDGRPLRALPAAADPHRARPSELSQPPRLLGSGAARSSASSRSSAPGAAAPRGRRRSTGVHWPAGALLGARRARRARLDRRPRPAAAPATRARGGADRRAHGRAPRARASSRSSSSRRIRSRSSSSCRRCTSGSGCRRCAAARVRACARSSCSPASPGPRSSSGRSPAATASAGTRRGTSCRSSRSATRRCRASSIALAWAAAAGQLVALAAGRYAPYPTAAERPPRGPLRQTMRSLVLAQRRRRRASEAAPRALHG